MSLFERSPRDDAQSDPSTRQALRRLQGDPVRLAALLAGANSVVPRRRRRGAGMLTASTVMILLLLSAVEAPDLFAAVGWTSPHSFSARDAGVGRGARTQPHTGYSDGKWYAPSAAPSTAPSATSHTPPPTLAGSISPTSPLARSSVRSSASPAQTQTSPPSGEAAPSSAPSDTSAPSQTATTTPSATPTQSPSSIAPSPTPTASASQTTTPTPTPTPAGHGKKPHGGGTANK